MDNKDKPRKLERKGKRGHDEELAEKEKVESEEEEEDEESGDAEDD
jgi:hypothetical protein